MCVMIPKMIHRQVPLAIVLIAAMLVALVPAPATAAPAVSPTYSKVYYWVQPGDTLSEIAAWHGTTTQALMKANGIYNPNHIYVGQKLYIPYSYKGGYSKHVGGPQCYKYHTVKYGQTLSHIAAYYYVNAHAMAQLNGIYDWNHIYVGQRLCIPDHYKQPTYQKPQPYHKPPVYQKPQPPKPQPKPHPTTCKYVVRYGDTLEKIAQWYGTTVQQLVYLNNLYHVHQLYVDQVLYVPGYHCQEPPRPPKPTPPPMDGWKGSYYNNKYFEGSPVHVQYDQTIHFDWGAGGPGHGVPDDRFSAHWERSIYAKTGTYRFYATSDDGVRVYVDGHLIIDQWNEQPAQSYFGDIYLGEGHHSIRVEYYEEGGVAKIQVWWDRL